MDRPEGFNYLPEEWRAYIADMESALSPARVAEVPVAEAHGFTIRGPQAHQIAAALNAVAPESPAKEQPGEVAEMVKRLRATGRALRILAGHEQELEGDGSAMAANFFEMSKEADEAAALLAKFGHGRFTPDPTVELLVNELCKPDSKETKY